MLPSTIRTALDVKYAVESAPQTLQPIGECVTAAQAFKDELVDDYCSEDSDEMEEKGGPTNKKLMKDLSTIYDSHNLVVDTYTGDFKLTVTRPGCEFHGPIERYDDSDYQKLIQSEDGLLKRWFDNTPQAGYGDVRAQETRVDLDVRDAHELTRTEFTLEEGLTDKVAGIWAKHFFPASVRVEPYKINVYAGGHFKPHKDTPEKDLVGTFLIGLGQSHYHSELSHLVVAGNEFDARPLLCIGFYPDVVHEVRPLTEGYRAMLAFKIFRRDEGPAEARTAEDMVRAGRYGLVRPIVEQLRAPFGVLFQRQYGISTTELSGFDAVVLDCARERAAESAGKLAVHVMPVLTHVEGRAYLTDSETDINVEAKVYPLTDAHVDIIMGREVEEAREKVKWLQDVADVPFFAIESMEVCGEQWKQNKSQGADYTGNESLPFSRIAYTFRSP